MWLANVRLLAVESRQCMFRQAYCRHRVGSDSATSRSDFDNDKADVVIARDPTSQSGDSNRLDYQTKTCE